MPDSKITLHYDAADPAADHAFWDKAIDDAHHANGSNNDWENLRSHLRRIETILIRSRPDPQCPDDREYDWDTFLSIYSNETETERYYHLSEVFPSFWDGSVVYQGGQISFDLFKQCMERLKNCKYRWKYDE